MNMRSYRQWMPVALLLVSFLGLLDASYLTAKHYTNSVVNCSPTEGCDRVLASQYASVLSTNIPVALVGVLYYVAIFALVAAYLSSKRVWFVRLAARITFVGFLASLWFMYLQIFVIKVICFYCMTSALSSTTLFVVGMLILSHYRAPENAKNPA